MNPLPVLIANGLEDILGFVVFLVIAGIIWAIQAFGKIAQKGRIQRPQPRPQQRPAQEPGLEDEIGDFLRRAARRRQAEQQPQPPPVAGRPGEQPVRAEVVAGPGPVRAEMLRERAREAARRQAAAGQAARRATQHGPGRAEAGPSMAAPRTQPSLPATPSLAPRTEPSAEAPRIKLSGTFAFGSQGAGLSGAPAAGLYALLSEPSSLRQAIVLSEVLSRPEDRW